MVKILLQGGSSRLTLSEIILNSSGRVRRRLGRQRQEKGARLSPRKTTPWPAAKPSIGPSSRSRTPDLARGLP